MKSVCEIHPNNIPSRDCQDTCYTHGYVTRDGETVKVSVANDAQVGGTHYVKHGDFQPWDAWWHWKLNAFQGAIIKYVVRYRDKNGVEDLKKARHYIDKLIECEEAARAGQAGAGRDEEVPR